MLLLRAAVVCHVQVNTIFHAAAPFSPDADMLLIMLCLSVSKVTRTRVFAARLRDAALRVATIGYARHSFSLFTGQRRRASCHKARHHNDVGTQSYAVHLVRLEICRARHG